jgi:hypothetical protein
MTNLKLVLKNDASPNLVHPYLSRAIMNQHTNWWFYSLIGWGEIFHLGLELS